MTLRGTSGLITLVTPPELAPFLPYAQPSKVAGVVIALVCFGIGAIGFVDSTATIGIQLGLAIPFGIIGLGLLYLSFRPAEKHPAIVALRDRGQDVVWIYSVAQHVNGRHSQTMLNIALADGKQKALAIGAATDPKPLLALLERSLPHATIGYSQELEKQFKRQPSSLRRG